MAHRRFGLITGTLAIVGLLATASVHGIDTPVAETMYLTVNRQIALPGMALAPGTYIFELADPRERVDIVRVSSRDRSRVYFTGFTMLVARPAGRGVDRPLVFGESHAGAPTPVAAWYPAHGTTGRQFVYPTGSRQLLGASTR